jgi:hypothetical protein
MPNSESPQKQKARKVAEGIINTLLKMGYINKDFDCQQMIMWVSVKAGGCSGSDPEHIKSEKEAMCKLSDIFTEAIDMYLTQQLEQMALKFERERI